MYSAGCSPSWKETMDYEVPRLASRIAGAIVPVAEGRGYLNMRKHEDAMKSYIEHRSDVFGSSWRENGFESVVMAQKYLGDKPKGGRAGVTFEIRRSSTTGFPHLRADLFLTAESGFYPCLESSELEKAYVFVREGKHEDLSREKAFAEKWILRLDRFDPSEVKK